MTSATRCAANRKQVLQEGVSGDAGLQLRPREGATEGDPRDVIGWLSGYHEILLWEGRDLADSRNGALFEIGGGVGGMLVRSGYIVVLYERNYSLLLFLVLCFFRFCSRRVLSVRRRGEEVQSIVSNRERSNSHKDVRT